MKNRFSFSTKIISTILVSILISILLTVIFLYRAYYSMVMNDAGSISRQQVDFLVNYIDDSLRSTETSLSTWMSNNNIKTWLSQDSISAEDAAAIKDSLSDLCLDQSDFTNAYLYSTKQQTLYHAFSETKKTEYSDITESMWISTIIRSHEFHASLYTFGQSTSLSCVIPIRNVNVNHFTGYCMGKISLRFFKDVFALCDYPYGTLYLCDTSGNIIHSTNSDSEPPLDIGGISTSDDLQTLDHNLVYCQSIPKSDFKVISICPNNIYSFANTNTFFVSLAISLICIFVTLTAAIFLLRRFLDPVRSLANTMALADPDHLKPVPLSGRQDEIGVLEEKYNDMIFRINDMIETQYRSDLAVKDAQLHALQLQINPHFVNNTLQMIGTLAAEHDMMDIYELLSAFSRMFYYCLKFKKETVLLNDELNYLRDYIEIQNGRFPGKLLFNSDIDPLCSMLEIPKMSLQPIIENSFAHSFTGITRKWEIKIEAHYLDTCYQVIITDNGCGMTEETLAEVRKKLKNITYKDPFHTSGSIGLTNVNTRIKLLYGQEYGIEIESRRMQGCRVTLTLPTQKEVVQP